MVVGIPAHVLHLAVAVVADVAEVDGGRRLLVVIEEHHHEVVVVGTSRQAVEAQPSDVDRLSDEEFETFRFRHTWQIVALDVLTQTIDVAVGFVLG